MIVIIWFELEGMPVSVHGTMKLENRNWKFGLNAFVLLINVLNFGPDHV
jgi:hypothetical protein